jgi:hypothetical protein
LRTSRIIGAVTAGFTLCVLLALWQAPRALDPSRYRGAIAAIASARLGRPVTIDGDVRLQFLPELVLTATRVTLADRGDGVSATVGALRLRVAAAPLLGGYIVPRDLVLNDPVLRLPWPLPADIVASTAARLPNGFSAQLEGGTLQLGKAIVAGLSAYLRSDADTGALSANGLASGPRESWRFGVLLGAPGADGVSTLNLTIDGEGAAQDTGGALHGRLLPSGVLEGMLTARGPDLSRLIAAPATPWRAGGALTASGLRIQAPDLDIEAGGSPGHARLDVRLVTPFGLDGAVSLGQIDLAGWASALTAAEYPPLPVHVDVSATAGQVAGGAMRDLHGVFTVQGGVARLQKAAATFPGGGSLTASGTLDGGLDGNFAVQTPSLRATLRWLHLAPDWLASLPPSVLTGAMVSGNVRAGGGRAIFSGLTGRVDGTSVAGEAAIGFQARPELRLALTLGGLDLVPWMPALRAGGATLATIGKTASMLDTDLHIEASTAADATLKLDMQTSLAGISVKSLQLRGNEGTVDAAGALHPDGTIEAGRLTASAGDARRVFNMLPRAWQMFPDLWAGGASAAMTADGKPNAVAAKLRVDLEDLRLEADTRLDVPARAVEATVTLRHPGAPRLLHAAGIDHPADWIDTGSVALAAHMHAQPGRIDVHDFALSAAALKMDGSAAIGFAGSEPALEAVLHATNLALPAPPARGPVPLSWLDGWHGSVELTADKLTLAGQPVAADAHALLTVSGRVLGAEAVQARIGHAVSTAEGAIDASGDRPRMAVRAQVDGLAIDGPLTGLPIDVAAGAADVRADILADGGSWPSLLATSTGSVDGTLHGMTLTGIDMGALTRALGTHAGKLRAVLQAALAGGETTGLNGHFHAGLADGAADIGAADFSGADGSLGIAGSLDLMSEVADMRLSVRPAVTAPPTLGVRLVGPWQGARHVTDVAAALLWAGRGGGGLKRR